MKNVMKNGMKNGNTKTGESHSRNGSPERHDFMKQLVETLGAIEDGDFTARLPAD